MLKARRRSARPFFFSPVRVHIMFYTNELDGLYRSLADKGVTVGEIVELPTARIFNFADDEDNYFAVMEKK